MMQPASNSVRRPHIGLALGSGSARGWAHIGVIRALEEAGIRPQVVCGTSIGALVGAAYAAGALDSLERWVRSMRIRDIVGFFDVGIGGGLLKGERLISHIRGQFVDRPLEDLPIPFAATATSLASGEEIWLRTGSTLDAVRASISLPGLFAPVTRDDVLLVDGGLVNPVPISLARAMGADFIIAVDLGADVLGRSLREGDAAKAPSMLSVLVTSLQIMQVRIARSRIAGEPPHVLVTPRLPQIALLDFHRADEAIEEGRRAVQRVAESLRAVAGHSVIASNTAHAISS
jgi:NTE family protein